MLVKVEVEQGRERVDGTLFKRVYKKKNQEFGEIFLSKHEKQRNLVQ